jgi:hypothetical protein
MGDFNEILMGMYPTPNEKPILEKRPIYSLINHGNDKYIANPHINVLNMASFYFLKELCDITQYILNIPIDQLTYVGNTPLAVRPLFLGAETALTEAVSTLLIYADKWMRNVPVHEDSHGYRSRFLQFMKRLKIQKTVQENDENIKKISEYQGEGKGFSHRYLSLIDRLENRGKEDFFRGSLAREAAVVLSIPYLLGSFLTNGMSFSYKIDETLAKYEAEMLTGIPGSKIPERTRNLLGCLYGLKTDNFVPLNPIEKIRKKVDSSSLSEQDKKSLVELQELENNDVNTSPEFQLYLENPPVIVPKYPQLGNVLKQ